MFLLSDAVCPLASYPCEAGLVSDEWAELPEEWCTEDDPVWLPWLEL